LSQPKGNLITHWRAPKADRKTIDWVTVPPVNLEGSEQIGLANFLYQLRTATLGVLGTLFAGLSSIFKSRASLQLENLALRHQLGVLRRSVKKPRLTTFDRFFWAWLCGVWLD
jgi:hypothetical protein